MVARASGLDSVVVRVGAAPVESYETPSRTSSGDSRRTAYLAYIYCQLDLGLSRPSEPPRDQPTEVAGDPLVGVEPFVVQWGTYGSYLASYLEGEKDPRSMEYRLFETLPSGLSSILSGQFGGSRPTRTWFHSDAPELSELPWELVAFADGHRASAGGSFVRGLPPDDPTPLLPLTGRLRLGLIDPGKRASRAFQDALTGLAGTLEVVRLEGGVRAGLRAAAEQGLELVHLVADGSVTSSYDGVLTAFHPEDPPIRSGEVAGLLRGSRVRLLGLTPPADDPATVSASGWQMPVAHRAFTYFATSPHPLPSIVAPLGPMQDAEVHGFWSTFYGTLGERLEIEPAMAEAQRRRMAAVALFLRQLQTGTFRQVSDVEAPATDPSVVEADLIQSRALVDQLETLKASLGVKTPALDKALKGERKRQSQLEADVNVWIEGVDER